MAIRRDINPVTSKATSIAAVARFTILTNIKCEKTSGIIYYDLHSFLKGSSRSSERILLSPI